MSPLRLLLLQELVAGVAWEGDMERLGHLKRSVPTCALKRGVEELREHMWREAKAGHLVGLQSRRRERLVERRRTLVAALAL